MTRTNNVWFFNFYPLVLLAVLTTVLTTRIQGHLLEFAVEPADTVVEAGQPAVLDCAVRAAHHQQTVLVQWLDQDQTRLMFIGDHYRSQLTNGSLYINSVVEEQRLTGAYQCMASLPNVGSIISRTATLSIASLKGFLEEPQNLQVFVGQKAYFACRAIANPPARIRWLKDERPLQIDELRMTVLPSGALQIDEVLESDHGTYRCNASGLNAYQLSALATLTIDTDAQPIAAPNFIARPRTVTVIENHNVSLDCAANGKPNPTITWLKDGLAIDMNYLDSRFSLVGSTTSLRITKIDERDGGTYQCRAENREDSLDVSAVIEIQVPPRFLKKPQDKVEYSTKDIELECSVYGVPAPKVSWYKNGELVKYTQYYKLGNGYNLKIMGLMVTDSGIFQCFASNPAGNIQAAASLKVVNSQEKPKPNKQRPKKANPKNTDYKQQSHSLFSSLKSDDDDSLGEVDFGHLLKYNSQTQSTQGVFNPHNVFNSLKSSESDDDVSLGNVQSAFSFPKSHAAGSSESKIIEGLPGPPQDLKAPIIKGRFVILSWKPPAENSNNIQVYSIYYRQEGSERERYQNTTRSKSEENIGGLDPGRVYHFRVVAVNHLGAGVSSEVLTLTTQSEEQGSSAPQDLEVFPTSSRSIHLKWKPPAEPDGVVYRYKIYYMETSTSLEHNGETSQLSYDITDLTPHTEYSVWVVPINENGVGAPTEEKTIRTPSATPSEPPYNITVEVSSTSAVLRWEPPPPEACNGVITGYKIKYRRTGKGKGMIYTTPASESHYIISELERGAPYQVRIWAMTINGTGPGSEWIEFTTLQNDMDESTVPGEPHQIRVRPTFDKLYVMWWPPEQDKNDKNIRVRNYILGWGKGIPDIFTQTLDEKNRTYIIERLEPNSEYVLSLRASNNHGPGPPIYTTVKTQDEPPPEPASPLLPPVGLKAQVISTTSVVLYWTDPTLKNLHYVTDNRYYTVKYVAEKSLRPKYKNVTDLNTMISELKPNTLYNFAVKLVKGRRESSWSMEVQNRTWEVPPQAAPRDLHVHLKEEETQLVELTWQPPKMTNGRVTGYIILYTDNQSKSDLEWQVWPVKGDNHTAQIDDLKPFTQYYFKIQARNSRGNGPFSNTVMFRTGYKSRSHAPNQGSSSDSRGVFSNKVLLYTIIGGCFVAVLTIAVVILFLLCCRKREVNTSPDRTKKGYQKGNQGVKPPDLWIHHDQMELKAMEKRHSNHDGASSSGAMTLPRSVGGNEYETHENLHTNSLDKRNYAHGPNYAIATPVNPTNISQSSSDTTSTPSGRPNYPRTNYSMPRAHVSLDAAGTSQVQVPEGLYSSHPHPNYDPSNASTSYSSQPPPGSTYAPGLNVQADLQAGKRVPAQGHPLKSFTVPAPPPISAPGTPQTKHVVTVRPNSSPFKKAPPLGSSSTLTGTPPSRISAANPPPHTAEEVQRLQPSHSTEELNQEMANLEGLMLTLNAITANEFEC